MSQQPSVLIVDDEASLRKTLRVSLHTSGFAVSEASNGEEALATLQNLRFDVILLDINMPGIGGIEACRRIRDVSPHAGILMITVRDFDEDKVRGLEAGADDYVTKPFKLRELTARIRAVLRRLSIQAAQEPALLSIGNLRIDFAKRLFWRGDEEIHLSPKEFDLLAFMMKNAGFPLTHAKLLHAIWGLEYGSELEYLRTYVRMLRRKIEADPDAPEYILTEPWLGYRFRSPSEAPMLATN